MCDAGSIERITVGRWFVNCYLVHDGSAAVIVDPGDEADTIAERVNALGIAPVAIVTTHAHFDHVGAVASLKRRFNVPFLLHAADRRLLTHANLYRSLAGDKTLIETPIPDRFLEPGESIVFGGKRLGVIHTPGHTAGSICLRGGDVILSGDTLFSEGSGRTDLPGGNADQMASSLVRLATEPMTLTVLPGHGPSAPLGRALTHITRPSEAG